MTYPTACLTLAPEYQTVTRSWQKITGDTAPRAGCRCRAFASFPIQSLSTTQSGFRINEVVSVILSETEAEVVGTRIPMWTPSEPL